jgi:hypothetical protein
VLGSEHKEKLCFGKFAVKVKDALEQGLGGSDKVEFWAGNCSHGNDRCGARALSIPTSASIFLRNILRNILHFFLLSINVNLWSEIQRR